METKFLINMAATKIVNSIGVSILIEIIEKLGSKVIAVAVNTENCTDEEAYAFQKEYTSSLGLPVLLPIQEGVAPVIPLLKALTK